MHVAYKEKYDCEKIEVSGHTLKIGLSDFMTKSVCTCQHQVVLYINQTIVSVRPQKNVCCVSNKASPAFKHINLFPTYQMGIDLMLPD